MHELSATLWGRRSSKRVLLCLHGYSGNSRDFDALASELAAERFVICPDVAGRGRSAWLPPAAYNFVQFLADIRLLLARLEVSEVDVVGTSMGGLLGMLLASQASSPVRRLVMNDVGAYLPADALRRIARNLDGPARFASIDEVEAHMRHTHREWGPLTGEQWRHIAIHGSRREGGQFRLHYDPALARIVQPVPLQPGLSFWDAWYRVRCPVLLVRGESSEVFPREVADPMLEIKPEAELVEIPGAGHAPSLMSAAEIEVVRDFLEGAGERSSMRAGLNRAGHDPHQRFHPPRAA